MTSEIKKDGPKILSPNLFPVVGIGASAGGLDAFKKLLKAIPENSGMAYVLVQHLDPTHGSLLPDLLQKVTTIPVLEITDDIKVRPDHIYIIPSNKMLLANDGILQLSPRPEKGKNQRNLPIDLFFNSLAEVHQSYAIGVVLSGTGSDGTLGLKAIKGQGGLTFAQDEESAAYDSMPHSAMMAGVVDFILPPEKIPGKLVELTNSIYKIGEEPPAIPEKDEAAFKQILSLLRTSKGTDFTYYKQTTIIRRIFRRIALNKSKDSAAYLKYLLENKGEQDALYQDLLISVTSFFRDPKVFDNLCESVFPNIMKNKAIGEPVRVWVAGCSTGEEAYSIAICLREFFGTKNERVQIFASDISEPAITKARAGIYSKSEVEGVSALRLQEFFTRTHGGYQLNKQIRDICVFAVHNFLKDPPFGKIDFVSCRNVLIYMEPYLQKKALTTFHYALNPKGFLLLGKSETGSSAPDLFATAGKNDKLFIRKDIPGRFMHVTDISSGQNFSDLNLNPKSEKKHADFQKTADDLMLRKYTPAGVVVNEAMDIVHFRGNTASYLEQAPGKPSHNLLKMAKDGLPFELRNIIHKAKKENRQVSKQNIPIKVNGEPQTITIEAIPLPDIVEPHYLILFHNNVYPFKTRDQKSKIKISSKQKKGEKDLRIEQLEHELAQAREDMRSITEDQEAANEELQSANEELLSGSEELQSLNEELETSKEELQTTNEELIVLNQELISLNEQVTTARNYAESIITTIQEPLLVLDKTLRVKTANNAFYKTFHVTEEETEGVLIYELGNKQWNTAPLRKLLEEILPKKTKFSDFEVKHEFPTVGERIMLLYGCEIARQNSEENLILLVIKDITEQVIARNKNLADQQLRAQELEEKVRQRTFELGEANELLRERNAELGKMNKELESFTYVSSHDLQEPLRKIQTFSRYLLEKEYTVLSDKGKDYFNRIQSAADRMQQLIDDLLAFSKINLDERKFENTDLNIIVQEVKNDLNETIEEKRASIETTELGRANVIPFQFRQLLYNLVSNSLKFSKPETSPRIVIRSRNVIFNEAGDKNLLPGKEYCHITFADNGIGFESHFSEQIFEVFQKLHAQEEYSGTGIGLAIVRKIVENHNGVIAATSELGKGTTFDIYIPV
jgi:two-component system, chemotaxis family, CheB/CheR fusion protein